MKKYLNTAFVYMILAMVGGVFYREFTKAIGFAGNTMLSVMHTHYFVLGMGFFLLLMILEKNFNFSNAKSGKILIVYHVGLNVMELCFLVRGILQALELPLSRGVDAAISGIAGLGHIALGVSMVMLMLNIKKSIK